MILPMLGRRAGAITTVSSLSRDHLIEFGIAPADRITVTYNGADHAGRWDPAAATFELGQRPYVFCIGQKQAYKNMELVWSIAPALDAMGLDVYMAGVIGKDVLQAFGGEWPSNLRLLGRVSDDDLAKAFQSAFCFLFPSRIEGFGLPAIEAMIWNCPVVAADAPCLPEVLGEAAFYAGPDDSKGWIAAVKRLQTDSELRERLIGHGIEQAARYSWRRIAETYLELMAEMDGFSPVALQTICRASIRVKSAGIHEGRPESRP
jgi:glycosyltransferase involved in cell wall biosynthesis